GPHGARDLRPIHARQELASGDAREHHPEPEPQRRPPPQAHADRASRPAFREARLLRIVRRVHAGSAGWRIGADAVHARNSGRFTAAVAVLLAAIARCGAQVAGASGSGARLRTAHRLAVLRRGAVAAAAFGPGAAGLPIVAAGVERPA